MNRDAPQLIGFTLGDRLRKARVRAGFDQQELADRICVHRHTVSNYELGHGQRPPKLIVLRAWADACGVPFEELVPDTGLGSSRTTGGYVPVLAA